MKAEPVHILSLGAGVQSSTMALMAAHGEITPMPIAAVFADTQDETKALYRWLAWLEPRLPFPVVRVSTGKLSLAAQSVRTSRAGNRYVTPSIPVFFNGGDGRGGRQCTMDFKITPILRYANMIRGSRRVTMWIGISTDEMYRMKDSRKPWADNRHPLFEKRMTRTNCSQWMAANGYPEPPRSACRYCPHRENPGWLLMKEQEPEEFAIAVQYERDYQAATVGVFENVPFLHRSCVPLDEVDLRSADEVSGQRSFSWQDECEGMCGV